MQLPVSFVCCAVPTPSIHVSGLCLLGVKYECRMTEHPFNNRKYMHDADAPVADRMHF